MGTSPHNHQNHHEQTPSKFFTKKLISRTIYILLPLALLHLYLNLNQPRLPRSNPYHPHPSPQLPTKSIYVHRRCDYTDGRWIQSPHAPLYNGTTCATIKDGQNYTAHGRPDAQYLYYRWQPNRCSLQNFDASAFLNLIRNRHLAFMGDSMARNQLESLLCLLSTKSNPELVYRDGEKNKFRRWVFKSHNATVSMFWSPFLVKGVEKSATARLKNHNKLYLDSADERWASELETIDLIVFSIEHWFLHPAIYHENDEVLGCHHCPEFNHTEIGFFDVFRKAVRTALRVVKERHASMKDDKFVVVTTFSLAHFEGERDKPCLNTQDINKEVDYIF